MKNERAIEELLAEMLRKQDQQTEVLRLIVDAGDRQAKLLSKLNDKIDMIDENRKMDNIHLQGSLARIENELNLMRPLLERALDYEARLRKIENVLFQKGA